MTPEQQLTKIRAEVDQALKNKFDPIQVQYVDRTLALENIREILKK